MSARGHDDGDGVRIRVVVLAGEVPEEELDDPRTGLRDGVVWWRRGVEVGVEMSLEHPLLDVGIRPQLLRPADRVPGGAH